MNFHYFMLKSVINNLFSQKYFKNMIKKLFLLLGFLSFTSLWAQITFQEQEVTSFSYGPKNSTADIDNDGNMDFVSQDGYWYKNRFPQKGFMPKKRIMDVAVIFTEITDFDGDGDLDAFCVESATDKVFLSLYNDQEGTFDAPQLLRTISGVVSVKHIDMDNDGDKDLVYQSYYGMGYYENTGQSANYINVHHITEIIPSISSAFEYGIQVADFDGNGYPDIYFEREGNIVCIKNNDGTSFSISTISSNSLTGIISFDFADIDNDGDIDLVAIGANYKLFYKLNNGLGEFSADAIIRQGLPEYGIIKLTDVDNDSKVDIFIGNIILFSWYKNLGSNSFADRTVIDSQIIDNRVNFPTSMDVKISDFNNDGLIDILTSLDFFRTSVHLSVGGGSFAPPSYPALAVFSAATAIAGDVDGDGDLDILTASPEAHCIFLYKKSNADEYENPTSIEQFGLGVDELAFADIDGDGDLDIVAVMGDDAVDEVVWYKNLDGLGNFSPKISLGLWAPISVDGLVVYDVDADGDMDIVIADGENLFEEGTGDAIVWYANDGQGNFTDENIIGIGSDGVNNIIPVDIDNDGDLDIVSSSVYDDKVCWYENLDGNGNFGPQRIITSGSSIIHAVVADVDSDGDNDVIYVELSMGANIVWRANLDGLGNFGEAHMINSRVDVNPSSEFFAADIDNDSDIDIIFGGSSQITWYENLHGQGNFEPPKIISTNASIGTSIEVMDADGDGDKDILLASHGTNEVFWLINEGTTQNTIKGVVRFTREVDGCNDSHIKLPNILVSTTDGTSTLATLTFPNEFAGQYRLYTGTGNFVTSVTANVPNYFTINPSSHSTSFNEFGQIDTADFCINPIGNINDLNVALYPLTGSRPGFRTSYKLVYSNVGITTLSGQATVQYDNTKCQFSNFGTNPSSQTANSLSFDFNNLAPFETRTAMIYFDLFEPPTTNNDDELVFTATVTPSENDHTIEDNTFTSTQIVIGSYDPNDITCVQGDRVLIQNADKYLHYVIRFQNTGTASAINVEVLHELDEKLDWSTFQLENMSHNARVTIKDESLVEFMFNNIHLPQRDFDDAGSNGYILFKIKPKANTIVVDDTVQATANIYFDFNPPITTNTAITTYGNTLGADSFSTNQVTVYPNPVKEQLTVTGSDAVLGLQVHTILGTLVLAQKNKSVINVSNLQSGVYLLTVTTQNGTTTKKFIKQ